MSKTKNRTLDIVTRKLGGRWYTWDDGKERWGHGVYLVGCDGATVLGLREHTEANAIAALEAKLRECAKEVLSDEWSFSE